MSITAPHVVSVLSAMGGSGALAASRSTVARCRHGRRSQAIRCMQWHDVAGFSHGQVREEDIPQRRRGRRPQDEVEDIIEVAPRCKSLLPVPLQLCC
jgi:hypothetical protein